MRPRQEIGPKNLSSSILKNPGQIPTCPGEATQLRSATQPGRLKGGDSDAGHCSDSEVRCTSGATRRQSRSKSSMGDHRHRLISAISVSSASIESPPDLHRGRAAMAFRRSPAFAESPPRFWTRVAIAGESPPSSPPAVVPRASPLLQLPP